MHIETIPRLPEGAKLIIVGDIHGCLTEFNTLIDRVKYNPSRGDVLLLLGDLVNKGPDSIGVVRRAIDLNARCILGNHEVSLLARMADPDVLKSRSNDQLTELARVFPRDLAAYLRSLPYIYRIPQFNLIAVHAGLNPTLSLEEQSVWEAVHMRAIDPATGTGHEDMRRGVPWAQMWRGPEHVVFGHDARSGLQQLPFATGLDTGCCYGRHLTALVYPGADLVQVRSKFKPSMEDRKAAAEAKFGIFSADAAVRMAAAAAVPVESPYNFGSPLADWGTPAASPAFSPAGGAAAGGAAARTSAFSDPAIASAYSSNNNNNNNNNRPAAANNGNNNNNNAAARTSNNNSGLGITNNNNNNSGSGELNVEQLILRSLGGNTAASPSTTTTTTNNNNKGGQEDAGAALLKLLQGGSGQQSVSSSSCGGIKVPAPASQRSSTNVTPPAGEVPAQLLSLVLPQQLQKTASTAAATAAAAGEQQKKDAKDKADMKKEKAKEDKAAKKADPQAGAAAAAAATAAAAETQSKKAAAGGPADNNNSPSNKKENKAAAHGNQKTAECSRALAVRELAGSGIPRPMFESIVLTLLDSSADPATVDAVISDTTIREAVWGDVLPALAARLEEGTRGDEMLLLLQDIAAGRPDVIDFMKRSGVTAKMAAYFGELAAKPAALPAGLSVTLLKETMVCLK